jgi:hypothetical protein
MVIFQSVPFFLSCWNKDPNNRPSMEQVVKEISHLFQFFPDEIPPLEYPNQSDLIDAGGKIFAKN